jgi:ATP-binding protein involved in chromosome partitioning
MTAISETQLQPLLQAVTDPGSGRTLGEARALKSVRVDGTRVAVALELGYPAASQHAALREAVVSAARQLPGVGEVSVEIATQVVAHAVQRGVQLLPGVKNIIAVASGKGGVGKSTTAANLALALHAEGARVGVLDADVYGPSQPLMLGASGRPESHDGQTMEPHVAHGLQVNSIGFLVDDDQAMIWRGPMATQALEPPGTGDIQLTLSQRVPVTGAVIVTTPQDIALIDAKKGLKMFEKVGVPILGIVENMAVHICSNCGHAEHIFGAEGGQKMAAQYGTELLASLPLAMSIRAQADAGTPTVAAEPDGEVAALYKALARKVASKLAAQGKDYSSKFPTISISKNS